MKRLKLWSRKMFLFQLLILLLLLVVPISVTLLQKHTARVQAAGAMPYAHGNRMYDGFGNPLILRGAHIESSLVAVKPYVTPTELLAGQHLTSATFNIMRNSWNMNVVRIATSDYIWKAGKNAYIATLQKVVSDANQSGLYVVLSLHEDLKGGATYGENANRLPSPLAIPYWQAVAKAFKTNPMVMFDLYNEPNLAGKTAKTLSNQDWQLWLHGGYLPNTKILVHGMQELVDAVRQEGAKQILFVEALNNSYETFNADGTGGNFVHDSNLVYSTHIYFQDIIGRSPSAWDLATGSLYKQFPVYIGEWAFEPNAGYAIRCDNLTPDQAIALIDSFLQYMQQNNISWTVFAFTIKQLFLDYTNYTPTRLTVPSGASPWTCPLPTPIVGDGYVVQQYLLNNPPG